MSQALTNDPIAADAPRSTTPSPDVQSVDVARVQRAWLRTFFALTIGGLLAVAGLNFVVNPFAYYPTHVVPPLTWSSRPAKVQLLESAAPFEVLILGSSHTMKVAPRLVERLSGRKALNASVDSARVEDWSALLATALARPDLHLKEIVLGIDPEAFHDHLAPDSRLLGVPSLLRHVPLRFQLPMLREAAESALTFGQTLASFTALRMRLLSARPPQDTFDADGFLHYVTWEREVSDGTFVPSFEMSVAEYESRYARFDALDVPRRALFEEMLAAAAARHIRVRAFVTPLHHSVRDDLDAHRGFARLRLLLRDYLDTEARTHPEFTWVDYVEPESFGGDPEGFFDGAHPRDETMTLLIEALYAKGP